VQIFVGGEFVGGASELSNLIETGELANMLSNTQGRQAFPSKIADLVKNHTPSSKGAAKDPEDEKAEALGNILANELTWTQRRVGYVAAGVTGHMLLSQASLHACRPLVEVHWNVELGSINNRGVWLSD
jgi:hypothetical protein